MLKRILIVVLLVGGFSVVSAAEANAWIVRRVAPVRRVAARAVVRPYPVARRVVAGPVVRRRVVYSNPVVYSAPPVVYSRPVVHSRPVVYAAPAPVVYGPAVSVSVGGGYYGW